MCFFKPKAPKVPDMPKTETIDTTSTAITAEAEKAKRRKGFTSTIATSGLGVADQANIRKKYTGE
jgi:hypothetical protein